MDTIGVLLLGDSRLPSGTHSHSSGVEMAVDTGLVSTVEDLTIFLRGRLRTIGPVLAGFAAAACALTCVDAVEWAAWDDALAARTLAPALREASRAQGAALLRTTGRMWPDAPALLALARLGRPQQPLVLGAAVAAAGGTPSDAASLAVHHLIAGSCSAAIRLLGLDPIEVAAAQAELRDFADRTAESACHSAELAVAAADPMRLPATGSPLPDLLAVRHAQQEVTLFAS